MRLDFNEEHAFWYFGLPPCPLPIIPITMIGPRGKSANTYGLLDSGADVSMFHADWARKIGLNLTDGRFEKIAGINQSASIDCYSHNIRVIVGAVELTSEVLFSEFLGDDITSQLIGRQDIFDQMRFGLRQRIRKIYIGRKP